MRCRFTRDSIAPVVPETSELTADNDMSGILVMAFCGGGPRDLYLQGK